MTANYFNSDYVRQFISENYSTLGKTIKIVFQKRNGEERTMLANRNDELLSTVKGVRPNQNPMTKVLTESLSDGTSQFRSVPLDRVFSIEVID